MDLRINRVRIKRSRPVTYFITRLWTKILSKKKFIKIVFWFFMISSVAVRSCRRTEKINAMKRTNFWWYNPFRFKLFIHPKKRNVRNFTCPQKYHCVKHLCLPAIYKWRDKYIQRRKCDRYFVRKLKVCAYLIYYVVQQPDYFHRNVIGHNSI